MKFTRFLIFLSCAISTGAAFGQVIVSNSTDITQDVNLGSTALWIGYTNSNVELLVDNATLKAGNVIVGGPSEGANNVLSFDDGVGSFSGSLFVGYDSADNEMTVDDDSAVTSYNGIIGYLDDANGNTVVVTDDSSWDVTDILTVGEAGALNSLSITDEAAVTANSMNIGVQESATNNRVLVSDSTLEVDDTITVGIFGTGNQLIITNGGTVSSADAWVGSKEADYDDGDDDNDDNTVLVTGADSSWTIDGNLEIGTEENEGNVVIVTNGGSIEVESLTIVGEDNGFNLDGGGMLTVSSDFNASTTGFSFNAGGALYVGGELTGMTNGIEEGRMVGISGGGNWDQSGSNVTVGGSSSDNALVVDGGTVSLADLQIGSVSNSGNTVVVSSSGKIVADDVMISGADSTLTVNGGGWLMVDTDFNAGMDGFEFGKGGVLETTGTLTGMTNALEDARQVHLTGGSWNVGGELTVGGFTSSNAVYVNSGAKLTSADSVIGGTGASNMVRVQGLGSLWNTGSLEVRGSGNQLVIWDRASVVSSGALTLQDHAVVTFSNGTATVASYYQDASSVLEFSTVTNASIDPGAALIQVGGTAELSSGASVIYTGSIGAVDAGVTNSRKIISSNELVADLDELNGEASEGLIFSRFHTENDDLYYQYSRSTIADAAGFSSSSMMRAVSDEIDQLVLAENPVAENQWDLLNQMDSPQMNSQLTQLYEQSAPTYAHMDGLFEGMRQVKNRGVMPDSMWPIGAYGPHLYGSQVQGWVKGYGSWASRDGEGGKSAYDQSIYGVVLGFDKAFGDFLAGVAGGYVSSDISQDNGDSSKAGTGYGVLYGSWGTSDWFADGSVALGLGSVKNDSGTIFDASSDVDANQFAFNLSGGKELVYMEDRLFITPSAGILSGVYSQDAYTEKSSNAVAKQVDAYSFWSFQSELGVEVGYHKELTKNVLMPEVHANWLHQFNTDADQLGYSLVGGTGNYSFGMQAPVADLLEVGVGLSLWTESEKGTVSEWVLGFDSRFGDGYSATALNARMLFEF